MKKVIVTADVHGSLSAWLTLENLLGSGDSLMIAGDLFDTRYGNYSNIDFQPDSIKKALNRIEHQIYYIHGNCDTSSFFPGFTSTLKAQIFNKQIFMHHGHRNIKIPDKTDIVIQGHTHLGALEKINNQIFLNPGSIAKPRNGLYTYATIDDKGVSLVLLETGEAIVTINF